MKNRLISLLLMIGTLLSLVIIPTQAVEAPGITEAEVKESLDWWEDFVTAQDVYFTYTGKPCNEKRESGHGCDNCRASTGKACALNKNSAFFKLMNGFLPSDFSSRDPDDGEMTHYNGPSDKYKRMVSAKSCAGFAVYASWHIFAGDNKESHVYMDHMGYGKLSYEFIRKNAKPGDVLRLVDTTGSTNGHSVILISAGEKKMKVLDCNYSGPQCKIQVHEMSYTSYNYATITRARNYLECKEHEYEYGVCVNCGEMEESMRTYLANECEFLPTNVYLKLDKDYPLRSLPLSPSDENDSKNVVTLPKDTIVEVTGLYKNHFGNYWYSLEYDNATRFLYSERGYYYSLPWAKISGVNAPSTLETGKSFSIGGTITAINKIINVTATVRDVDDRSVVIQSSAAPNAHSYSLKGSTVDNKLKFGSLTSGNYVYQVEARVEYYLASGKDLRKETSGHMLLIEEDFTVKHTHSYSKKITAPTCTADGYTTYTCSCGHSYTSDPIPSKGHQWEERLIGKPCQEASVVEETCTVCKKVQTTTVNWPIGKHFFISHHCYWCGIVDPAYEPVNLTPPTPSLGLNQDLNMVFGASGMDNEDAKATYLILVAVYHQTTGAMMVCEQFEATKEELKEAALDVSMTVPENVPLIWKTFMLDPDTMAPACPVSSGNVGKPSMFK